MVNVIAFSMAFQRGSSPNSTLILDLSKYSHISPELNELHWLAVQVRIHLTILRLVYSAIHGLLPQYIMDFISVMQVQTLSQGYRQVWRGLCTFHFTLNFFIYF